jgi:uncharacterized protein (TIGR02302 family)
MSRLARQRWVARLVLGFEQIWLALWPALGLFGLYVLAALLDLPAALPPEWRAALLGLTALGALGLLGHGLRGFRWPDRAAAERRIERASGLAHRPLATLADRPALPEMAGLWQAHLAAERARLGGLRSGWPHPGLARRDRRALRAALLVALAAALVIAGPDAPLRLARAFHPDLAFGAATAGDKLEAWITPPGYTGLAPIFLHAPGEKLSVPAGSRLSVNLSGARTPADLVLNGAKTPFKPLDPTSFQAEMVLTESGRLVVRQGWATRGAWDLAVTPNTPPVIAFTAPPGPVPRRPLLRLPWQARDQYGVVAATAEMVLAARPDAAPLSVPIPLPSGPTRAARGSLITDLTAHPWAGLAVSAHLTARDAAGLTGASESFSFVLPERNFANPIAAVLAMARKSLSQNPSARSGALELLDGLAAETSLFASDWGGYLNERAIAALLRRDPTAGAVTEAQARLWQLALHFEEGRVGDTARALEAARQALHDALEQRAHGDQPDAKTLDQLLRRYQEALAAHLAALARQARQNPALDQAGEPIDPSQIARMAEEMREAAAAGRTQEAEARLQALEHLMKKLRAGRPHPVDPRQAQAQKRLKEAESALQELVKRQGALLDRAQARAEAERGDDDSMLRQPGGLPLPGLAQPRDARGPSPLPGATSEQQSDQRAQAALRERLKTLHPTLAPAGAATAGNLTEAEQAMRQAEQALTQNEDDAAAEAEAEALGALERSGQDLARAEAKGQGEDGRDQDSADDGGEDQDQLGQSGTVSRPGDGGDSGQGGARGPHRLRRDPLGRSVEQGSAGGDEATDVMLPDTMEQARSRAIEDELRRRGAERTRPEEELRYIDRLLQPF